MGKSIRICIIIAVSCVSVFFPLTAKVSATPKQFELMQEAEKQEKDTQSEFTITRPTVEYKADDLEDPFKEPFSTSKPAGTDTFSNPMETSLPNFTVQGLIWGGDFPQAIINNKVLKVGDTIEDARIVSIDKAGVSLFYNERQYHLSTGSGDNKSSSKP